MGLVHKYQEEKTKLCRVPLTDGTGRWFNPNAAQRWVEGTWWDGSNNVSSHTDSQWEHQWLYLTAGKRWILHTYSQCQGIADTYTEITTKAAAAWLVVAEEEIPAALQEEVAKLEIE